MKKLIIGAIISVVFACGVFVYTKWENRRFVNSFTPPVVDEHTHPHEHPQPQEETAPATPSSPSVFDTQTIIVEKSDPSETREEETSEVETDYVEENSPEWQTGDEHEHKSTTKTFRGELTDIDEMDPDDLVDMIRVGLLKQFGDIPEVHTFVELTRKMKKNQELTLDERIDFTAAQYHLWPDPRTKETLEIFLEKKATEYPRSTKIVR